MPTARELVQAGYTGYQGWGDREADADFRATGGAGKYPQGGGGGSGGGRGVRAPFNYDYVAEGEKAYGELAVYYDRILKEAKGDLNLALSRLVEDYDRGLRIRRENTTLSEENLNTREQAMMRSQERAAISRGVFTKSAFDPNAGYGVYDTNLALAKQPFQQARRKLTTGLANYEELYGPSGIGLTRKREDTTRLTERKEFELEQARRKEAAELANMRGERAYRKYASELV